MYSVCININIIGICNLEINPIQEDTQDLLRKARYILDSTLKKSSFKLVSVMS